MDSKKLKRTHLILNILILVVFVAFVAVIAILVKDRFFADIGKIFTYMFNFVFKRPWDVKTYLTLIGGTAVSILAVFWITRNVIRKRGIFSYIAPLLLVMIVLMGLVTYKWRNTFNAFMNNPDTKTLTFVALILLIDICLLAIINAFVAHTCDKIHDKNRVVAVKESDDTVAIQNIEVVKEDVEEVEPVKEAEPVKEEPVKEEPVKEEVPPVEEKVEAAPVVVKEKKKYDTLDPNIYGEIIRRTFMEKYQALDDDMKRKYLEIRRELLSYQGVRSRISKHCDSYRVKKVIQVKINIQGKTLKVFYALDPKAYAETTIPVIDVSAKKVYAEVPTLLKVKSDLSVKRAKNLVNDVMAAHGIERSLVAPAEETLVMKQDLEIIRRSFVEKMLKAPKDLQDHYDELKSYILAYGVKSRVSATADSFRLKRNLLMKMTVQGKQLKVFYAIDPATLADTKIPVRDVSHKKSYADVPTLLKVKSSLSFKRAKGLVDRLMKAQNLTQKEIVAHPHARDLRKAKRKKAKAK